MPHKRPGRVCATILSRNLYNSSNHVKSTSQHSTQQIVIHTPPVFPCRPRNTSRDCHYGRPNITIEARPRPRGRTNVPRIGSILQLSISVADAMLGGCSSNLAIACVIDISEPDCRRITYLGRTRPSIPFHYVSLCMIMSFLGLYFHGRRSTRGNG